MHLEVGDTYAVPAKSEPLRRFLAGEARELGSNPGWNALADLVTGLRARGATVARIRVVTEQKTASSDCHCPKNPSVGTGPPPAEVGSRGGEHPECTTGPRPGVATLRSRTRARRKGRREAGPTHQLVLVRPRTDDRAVSLREGRPRCLRRCFDWWGPWVPWPWWC
ncbi:DUF6879 family protein [Nocardia farcinica]|uniref:DUF6879 family protein n=1 Tax=Nocardia farcinica TaxID=37329 RepID=UPI003CC7F1BD